jgi:hypothetical protein
VNKTAQNELDHGAPPGAIPACKPLENAVPSCCMISIVDDKL